MSRHSELADPILDLVRSAGAKGIKLAQLSDALITYADRSVQKVALRLVQTGQLFRYGSTQKATYYSTREFAWNAEVEANRQRDQLAADEQQLKLSLRRERAEREKAAKPSKRKPIDAAEMAKLNRVSEWGNKQVTVVNGIKRTTAPTPPGRYEVTELPKQGFLSEWRYARRTGHLPERAA
jgi:hypothetical protein